MHLEERTTLCFSYKQTMPLSKAPTVASSMLLFLRTRRRMLISSNWNVLSSLPNEYESWHSVVSACTGERIISKSFRFTSSYQDTTLDSTNPNALNTLDEAADEAAMNRHVRLQFLEPRSHRRICHLPNHLRFTGSTTSKLPSRHLIANRESASAVLSFLQHLASCHFPAPSSFISRLTNPLPFSFLKLFPSHFLQL